MRNGTNPNYIQGARWAVKHDACALDSALDCTTMFLAI